MDLQELLDAVAKAGLNVTQWREMMSGPASDVVPSVPIGGWWCELRHKRNGYRDSDTGPTAYAALEAALARAQGKKGMENRPIHVDLSAPKKKVEDLDFLD